jgi:hypothetical protein
MKISHRLLIPIALVWLIPASLLTGCSQTEPITSSLSFSEPPLIGKPVELILTFSLKDYYRDNPIRVTSQILLPENIELVSGNLEWEVEIEKNRTYEHHVTIKTVDVGYYSILSHVVETAPFDFAFGVENIYMAVFEDSAEVSHQPLPRLPKNGHTSYLNRISAELSLSEPPVLGKPVEVTYTFRSEDDADNAFSWIRIPEGFELVEGNLEWKGILIRNQTYTMKATIRAVRLGNWKLEGMTTNIMDASNSAAANKELYVSMSENGTEVSDVPVTGVEYQWPPTLYFSYPGMTRYDPVLS